MRIGFTYKCIRPAPQPSVHALSAAAHATSLKMQPPAASAALTSRSAPVANVSAPTLPPQFTVQQPPPHAVESSQSQDVQQNSAVRRREDALEERREQLLEPRAFHIPNAPQPHSHHGGDSLILQERTMQESFQGA